MALLFLILEAQIYQLFQDYVAFPKKIENHIYRFTALDNHPVIIESNLVLTDESKKVFENQINQANDFFNLRPEPLTSILLYQKLGELSQGQFL